MIRNVVLYSVVMFGLFACDNPLYNRFFRNPHIVQVANVDSIKANERVEFETSAKAFHDTNEIYISLKGIEVENLDVIAT